MILARSHAMTAYPDTSHWTDIARGELADHSEPPLYVTIFSHPERQEMSRLARIGYFIGTAVLLSLACSSGLILIWLGVAFYGWL